MICPWLKDQKLDFVASYYHYLIVFYYLGIVLSTHSASCTHKSTRTACKLKHSKASASSNLESFSM